MRIYFSFLSSFTIWCYLENLLVIIFCSARSMFTFFHAFPFFRDTWHLDRKPKEFDGQKWDFFISHNWSVKRWQKFLALCLVWSGKKALIFCVCAQLIFFTLVSTGILPVTHSQIDGHEISIWCVGSCLLTYAATFLVHHEVLDLLGIPGYRIFLDKVCVDQSDDQRKRQGIQSITAFLYHSEALVVLYSELLGYAWIRLGKPAS